MYVAIDSSKSLSCTGIVSGSDIDIINFYDEIRKIFAKRGVYPPFHWGKLTNSVRNSAAEEIENLVNTMDVGLRFNILHHRKPSTVPMKDILSEILPAGISEQLRDWIKNFSGYIVLEFDNDFNIRNMDTHDFIEKVFKKMFGMVTDEIIVIRYENGIHKATVKKKFGFRGQNLYFSGKVSNIRDSRGIQIIDLILGYVGSKKCKFRMDRLYIRRLC